MIFKMARDRTEDEMDVKRGAMFKDNKERLITESVDDMGGKLQGATERNRSTSCHELPSSVRREVGVEEIGQEGVATEIHNMKKARRQGQTKCG